MKSPIVLYSLMIALLFSCGGNNQNSTPEKKINEPHWKQPKKLSYKFTNAKFWLDSVAKDDSQKAIAYAVNRTDAAHFAKMDSVLIPTDFTGDLVSYLPFPLKVSALQEIKKMVIFSYPTQSFGVSENGYLVHAGQTNMGREKDQTPTGLFFANWKAKKTISTFNDEWELKWNFNIANKLGVGWHQYELPGFPASHSCLRLTEEDAKYLFDWADKWILENKNEILVKGTPVLVFGSYDFNAQKPWLQLTNNPKALNISEGELNGIISPYIEEIKKEQLVRENYQTQQKEDIEG